MSSTSPTRPPGSTRCSRSSPPSIGTMKTRSASSFAAAGSSIFIRRSPASPSSPSRAAYAAEIEQLKARGGYVTADVIDVTDSTPGLDAMLAKFSTEHWHDEDEVRFIIRGRG